MRTRKIRKDIYLNSYEDKELKKKARAVGLSNSSFIRQLIKGYVHDDNLTIEIHNLIYELNKIGNNINQIAYVANSKGVIVKYNLDEELLKLNNIVDKLNEKFFK